MTYSIAVLSVSNPASGSQLVALTATILLLGLACYGFGRVHQYFRQGMERDVAFRNGYNTATKSLFHEAIRIAKGIEAPPPLTEPPTEWPTEHVPIRMHHGTARVNARHRVEREEGDSTFQRTRPVNAWQRFRGQ
jgi:hypothetical protein